MTISDELFGARLEAYAKMLDLVTDALLGHRNRVLKELDGVSRKAFGSRFWTAEEEKWLTTLMVIESMVVEAAEISIDAAGFEVTGLVAEASSAWAGEHSGKLVKGIVETTRKKVAEATQTFIETPGMTQGELIELVDIDNLFGFPRAKRIAMTEVTNAYMQGAGIAKTEIERLSGLQMIHVWNTNNDPPVVCEECLRRHGRKQGDGWWELAAVHPGCRCWVTQEIA